MDILGFVLVVAGLIAANHYGYMGTGLSALRTAYRKCRNLLDRAELHFTSLAARRVVFTLLASAAVQLALLALATALLPTGAQTEWYGAFITMGALLIAAEILYAFYQRPGIPHILRDAQGQAVRWPEFLQNEQGEFVNEQGDVLHVNEDGGGRVPHPLAGLPRLDDERHPNLIGRISAGKSAALILFVFMVIGMGIMNAGVHGRSSLVFLLGAMCVYAMLMALQLVANILAWFVLKGTKLLEFIATVMSEQALVALPGIKWSNINTYLPNGIDLLDEEHAAAVLRTFPLWLALRLTPFVAVVWMWTDPAVAKFTLSLLFITTLAGWYLAKNGGALEVADRKYKFARLMFYALPTVCVLGFIAGFMPMDVKAAAAGQFANLKSGLVGFVNGQWGIGISPWYVNLAGIFFALVGAAFFGFILSQMSGTPEEGRPRRWIRNGLGLVTLGCLAAIVWFGVALHRNIAGKGEFRFSPVTPAAPLGPNASAMAAAAASAKMPQDKGGDTVAKTAESKPVPAVKLVAGGGRDKEPKRRTNEPPGSAPATERKRGELSPEFKELLRDLESK